jgi:hypothetical protein
LNARTWIVSLCCVVLAACAPVPSPLAKTTAEPTTEAWYRRTVDELAGIDRRARQSFQEGKPDAAAALIVKGEDLAKRLFSVRQPTLAATEAVSDLDELYGQMLFSNRNYGWARLLFQKNLVRWKYWKPRTPETDQRLKQAQTAIAECDRRISQ